MARARHPARKAKTEKRRDGARPRHTPPEDYREAAERRAAHSTLIRTEKMAALGQLVSGIAHELNNPLTSIMGYAQLLLGRLGPESAGALGQDARHIFEEAERARRIVRNLLLFARESKPERARVDLNEIIERTVALRAYELKVKDISMMLELGQGLPETYGDAHQLQQVILNLLVNAEHAVEPRVAARDAADARITIRTRSVPPARVAVEVSDNGPGISPEVAAKIFDPFFTTKPIGVGTGLGLSIVFGIVQEHGGETSVQSAPGRGATFTVELPAYAGAPRVPSPTAFEQNAPGPVPQGNTGVGRRALVIEDEPTVVRLILDVLGEEGWRAEAACEGREGLELILENKPRAFDLVICDLKMPRLDGPALYRELARRQHPARERVLFITGDTSSRRTLEFLEHHGVPYLAKPFLVDELKSAVARRLSTAAPTTAPVARE